MQRIRSYNGILAGGILAVGILTVGILGIPDWEADNSPIMPLENHYAH
jgi:hypothetical protein